MTNVAPLRYVSFSALIVASAIIGSELWLNSEIYRDVSGFSRIPALLRNIDVPLCLFVGTFLGLLCSAYLKSLDTEKTSAGEPTPRRSHKHALVFASLLSPVVLMSVYSQVSSGQPLVLVFLIAYQNGFFWETVTYTMGALRS